MMQDMDSWGYSFRLGSAQAWFERDAEDARHWLLLRDVIDHRSSVLALAGGLGVETGAEIADAQAREERPRKERPRKERSRWELP